MYVSDPSTVSHHSSAGRLTALLAGRATFMVTGSGLSMGIIL